MARHPDEVKREKILESAFTCFGKHGYRSTTIKQIADLAGVAPGSIYTYYADKARLYQAAVDAGWNQFLAEIKKAVALPDPYEEKLIRLIEYGIDLLGKYYPLLKGMFSESNRRRLFQKNLNKLSDTFEEFFSEGMKRGILVFSGDTDSRRFFIKVVIAGLLLHASLLDSKQIAKEVESMKLFVKSAFMESITVGKVGGQ